MLYDILSIYIRIFQIFTQSKAWNIFKSKGWPISSLSELTKDWQAAKVYANGDESGISPKLSKGLLNSPASHGSAPAILRSSSVSVPVYKNEKKTI